MPEMGGANCSLLVVKSWRYRWPPRFSGRCVVERIDCRVVVRPLPRARSALGLLRCWLRAVPALNRVRWPLRRKVDLILCVARCFPLYKYAV